LQPGNEGVKTLLISGFCCRFPALTRWKSGGELSFFADSEKFSEDREQGEIENRRKYDNIKN